jgi:hypothetical protein
MQFWSLTRTGITPVTGRPSLRAFRAAVHVCGAPTVSVRIAANRTSRWVELAVQFHKAPLFRCHFTQRLSPTWARKHGSLWFRADGTPRALKPSRWDNPISSKLNTSLADGYAPRELYLWERVLLALGF